MKQKKVVSTFIILLLFLCIIGCQAGTTPVVQTTTATEKQAETTAVTQTTIKQTTIESESVTTESVSENTSGETVKLEVFLDHTWYPTDKFEGIIPEAITAATGVEFIGSRAIDDQQRGLMIASNDLPEMIFTSGDLSRLSDSELCYSYTDLIAQYAPDWQPAKDAIVNASSYSRDGKYYFLFSHGFTAEDWASAKIGVPMVYTLYYRADLARKLGITEFNSMEDIDKFLDAVKEKMPEIWPMVYGSWGFDYWMAMTGINMTTNWEVQPDGTYIHRFFDDRFEDYCRKIFDYVNKGYVLTDSFAMNNPEREALMQTGKTATHCGGTQGYSYMYGQMCKQVDPDAEVLEFPYVNDVKVYLTGLGWCGTFITKKCKNPEAAIKVMQFLFSPEGGRLSMWGREGIEYTLDSIGAPQFSKEWVDANDDLQVFAAKYNTCFYFGASALIEGIGRIAHLDRIYLDRYDDIRSRVSVEPWYTLARPKDPESDEYIIERKLTDLNDNQLVPLFMASDINDFETKFATFRDMAKAAGVDQLTAYMNESIPKAKDMYK